MRNWLKTAQNLLCAGMLALALGVGIPTAIGARQAHPLDTLKQERQAYGATMAPAELATLLNRVAWVHRDSPWRLGLLRKTGGNRCPAPQNVEVSCDILVSLSTGNHYDVLVDAGGASTPVWNDIGPIDLGRFVAPVDTGSTPPPPPPPPPPPTVDLTPLLNRLDALERQNQFDEARHALIGEVLAGLHEQTADVQRRLAEVENRLANLPAVPVRCRASVLGIRVSCQLEFDRPVITGIIVEP